MKTKIKKGSLKQKVRKISSIVLVVALLLSLYTAGGITALAKEVSVNTNQDFIDALNDDSVDSITVTGALRIDGIYTVNRDLLIKGSVDNVAIENFTIASSAKLTLQNIVIRGETPGAKQAAVSAKEIVFSGKVYIAAKKAYNAVVADRITVSDKATVSLFGGGVAGGTGGNALVVSEKVVVGANAILDLRQGFGATTGNCLVGSGKSEAEVVLKNNSQFIVNAGVVEANGTVSPYVVNAYVKKTATSFIKTDNANTVAHTDNSGEIKSVDYSSEVESIMFNLGQLTDRVEVEVGKKAFIPVSVYPSENSGDVKFTSEDPTAVEIVGFKNGVLEVNVIKEGETSITAVAGSVTKTLTIATSASSVQANFPRVAFSTGEINIIPGQTINLNSYVNVYGEGITNKSTKFYTEDTTLSVVSELGAFVADSSMIGKSYMVFVLGTLVVDGTPKISYDTIVINVKKDSIAISSITSHDTIAMHENTNRKLDYWIFPDNHTDFLHFSSDNESVAKIIGGYVYAIAPGTAIIKIVSNLDNSVVKNVFVTVVEESAELISPVPPTSININIPNELLPVYVEDIRNITVKFSGGTTERGLRWKSGNPDVGIVDQNGTFKALKEGTTVISATSTADPDVQHVLTIEVKSRNITLVTPITEITAFDDFYMTAGTNRILDFVASPDAHTDSFYYSTTNNDVVAFSNGQLFANAPGTAVVRITSKINSVTKDITVHVSATPPEPVKPVAPTWVKISFPAKLLPVVVGDFRTFSTEFSDGATALDLEWISANPSAGAIDQSGKFLALAEGTTFIKATSKANPGVFSEFEVRVAKSDVVKVIPITEITAFNNLYMVEGADMVFEYQVTPYINSDTVSISSDDDSVVVVSNGKLYAKSPGTAIIKLVSTLDPSVDKYVTVTVSAKPAITIAPSSISIYISEDLLPIYENETRKFLALLNSGVTERELLWESANPDVGVVDQNGTFKALAEGNTIIRVASVANPDVFDTILITVKSRNIPIVTPITEIRAFDDLYMVEGTDMVFEYQVTPYINSDTVSISSNNENIVTFSGGKLFAIAPGTAVIKLVSLLNPSVEKYVTVHVSEKPVEPVLPDKISIYIPDELLPISVGDTRTFSAIFENNVSDRGFYWESLNTDVGTINQAGVFQALAAGKTFIKVTSTSNPNVFAHYQIDVLNKEILVSSISYNDTVTIDMDTKDFFIKPTIYPLNATNSKLVFSSNDTKIVKIDSETGRLDPQSVGYADIIIENMDTNITKKVTVFVNEGYVEATDINVGLTKAEIEVGESIRPIISFTPANATDKNYHIVSNNPDDIQYDVNTGYITASKTGVYTMSIYYENGTKSASFEVTVVKKSIPLKEIVASDDVVYMVVGNSKMISYSILPENATDTDISYVSNNLEVVSIAFDGIIQAVGVGHTTISIKDNHSGIEKLVEVHVVAGPIKVEKIDFEHASYNTVVGDVINPKIFFTPLDTTERDVEYVSSKPSVAYVDSATGKVTAISVGEAVIRVISKNNNTVEGQTIVYVERKMVEVTSVYFPATLSLNTDDELVNTNWKVQPFEADFTVEFESKNSSVVTVSKNGVIRVIGKGSTQVVMTVYDKSTDKTYIKTCAVTVSQGIIPLIDFTVTSPVEVEVGRQATLNVRVEPLNASDVKVSYKSLAPTTAHVDANGVITGIAVGETIIEVTVEAHGVTLVKDVSVNVRPFIIQPEEIVIENCPLYVDEGGKPKQIKWTVMPANATDKTVTMTVKNTADQTGNITVTNDGWVHGLAAGNANVLITTSNGLEFNCPIVVTPKVVKVTGVGLNYSSLNLKSGAYADLIATVYPTNAAEKQVSWHSNDLSVATVDQKGRVNAHKAGTAEITVKTLDGDFVAICVINVVDKDVDVIGISISPGEVYLDINNTEFNLKVTVYPTNATNQIFDITSSNTEVVTVSQTGKLTPKKEGMSIITVQTKDKKHTAKATIYVVTRATGITIDPAEKTLIEGETVKLNASVWPAGSNPGVIYSSANSNIASVTSDGLVVANKAGTTTITATSVDGGFTASCAITVRAKTTGIVFMPSMAKIQPGQSYETMIRGTNVSSTVKGLEYRTNDPNIAVVDKNTGVVTAIKPGVATIYAFDSEGYSAAFIIEVFQPITDIEVWEKVTVSEGRFLVVGYNVSPSNASNAKKLIWASKDEKIATVDSDGIIYGKSFGSTIVTVRSPDGNVVKYITVNVTRATPEFVRKTIYMLKGASFLIKDDLGINDNRSYTFKSFNVGIATVNNLGSIKAVEKGNAVIEVYCDGERFAEYTVIVKDKEDKLTVDPEFIHLLHKDTGTKLTPKYESEDVLSVTYTFSTSNSSVATVSSNGFVVPKAPGITIITITSSTGLIAQVNVHVKAAELLTTTVTLKPGQKFDPFFNVDDINYGKGSGFLPGTTDSSDIVWLSNNPTVATVDPVTGKITAVGAGTAIITAALRGNTQIIDELIVQVLGANDNGNGNGNGNGNDNGKNTGNGGGKGTGNGVSTGQSLNYTFIAISLAALVVFILTSKKSKRAV